MGANPKQALALIVFLVAFVALATAFYLGGTIIVLLLGLVLLGVSLTISLKAKPLEHIDG